jgi:dihydrofolate synthase/folylpolyglutamate synthase
MVKMPSWPMPLWHKPGSYSLERIVKLLAQLDNPHLKLPHVVHVTGTNGKGSTIAFLRAILEAAGYSVHCYTSPHLVRYNERIRIRGQEISDYYLNEIIEETRTAAEAINLEVTFFEGTTAAAFLAFAKQPADISLIEVGLGGRLDATNVFKNPTLTVITPISYDHMDILGHSLGQIAYEKAGIMRKNTPCIVAPQTEEAESMLESIAAKLEVPLINFEYDYGISKTESGFIYSAPNREIHLPNPSLTGEHQYINASTAITAALNLPNFDISEKTIIQGITHAYWPARLQRLNEGHILSMLSSGWELWVDGAHNESGAQVLSLWAEANQDLPLYMICGMTKGRDSAKFLQYFAGKVEFVCGVLVEAEPTSHKAEFIVNAAKEVGIAAAPCSSIEHAIEQILKISLEPARIIVCGSLYLAGDFINKNSGALRI